MLRFRISLFFAICVFAVNITWGDQADLPAPKTQLEVKADSEEVEADFIQQIKNELDGIPSSLSLQVSKAGISVYVAKSMSSVEPKVRPELLKRPGVFDSDKDRKRIIINRSLFNKVGNSYVVINGEKPTDQDLGSVVAHEFGHAYDWTLTYGEGGANAVRRSQADHFVSAFNMDQSLVASTPSIAQAHATYLDHFRGTSDVAPPDPLSETYAEAIAIHLAWYMEYRLHKGQLWFQRLYPNVMQYVGHDLFPELYPGHSTEREELGPTTHPPMSSEHAMLQPDYATPREGEFAGTIPIGARVPAISAVHEFDHPPFAYISGRTIRIRGTRFEVDVIGLDPGTEYRLLACLDGETIGDTDWFGGRDSYSIPTQVGFPPGRYRLTVQAFRRDPFGSAVQTSAVLINYQPTYLREMQHVRGRDVTAVTSHLAVSHRPLEDDGPSQPVQVRFVGLDNWNVYTYSADAKRFELEPHVIPRRRSFTQGRAYQLKIKHDAAELYPTLEIPRTSPQTTAFLAHSSVAVELKQPEIDYVRSGGMLTKVMYLPNRATHSTSADCVETKVGRCPGDCQDPIAEAAREGTILAILRLGERDLE